jgi:hypothetical protein
VGDQTQHEVKKKQETLLQDWQRKREATNLWTPISREKAFSFIVRSLPPSYIRNSLRSISRTALNFETNLKADRGRKIRCASEYAANKSYFSCWCRYYIHNIKRRDRVSGRRSSHTLVVLVFHFRRRATAGVEFICYILLIIALHNHFT